MPGGGPMKRGFVLGYAAGLLSGVALALVVFLATFLYATGGIHL